MGLKLLGFSRSRQGFLRMGVKAASLKGEGTVPEVRVEFKISVMTEIRQMIQALSRMEGMWSREQEENLMSVKILEQSAAVMD